MSSYGSDHVEHSSSYPWESEEVPPDSEALSVGAYASEGGSSAKLSILIGALAAILVISAVALFFFLRGNSEDSTSAEDAMNTVTVEATTVIDDPALNDLDSGLLDSEDPEAAEDSAAGEDSRESDTPPTHSRGRGITTATPEEDLPGGDLSVVARGTSVTSEPFALSVAEEYREFRERTGELAGTIRAYSEVTSMTYTMSCAPDGDEVVCRGGDNAVVIISGK